MEYILKYWGQFLFLWGIVVAILGKLTQLIIKNKKENESLRAGVLAMLHDRLFQSCSFYIEKGYMPSHSYEEIVDNITRIYKSYAGLGGNGTGTDIYERFMALPIRKEGYDEKTKKTDYVD